VPDNQPLNSSRTALGAARTPLSPVRMARGGQGTAVGVTLLLNASGVLGLLFLWTGIQLSAPGKDFGQITSDWHWTSWMLAWRVAPAVLLLALVRWRMKLREA